MIQRGRLFTGLGAAAGAAATMTVGLAKQASDLEDVPSRYLAGAAVPSLLAAVGLALYERRPRLSAAVVMAAAGWTAGNVLAGSGAGVGLFWAPAAVLLIQGAYTLLREARRR